ncbi:unnamed protein product, partial [Effrenium voratum]
MGRGVCLVPGEAVLQEQDIREKIKKVTHLLERDLNTAKLQSEVKSDLEERVAKEQKREVLMEQMRQIQKELGIEKDEKQTLTTQFRDSLKDKVVPEEVQKVIETEISKLNSLEPSSTEFNVCRTYLEWLTCLPWGKFTGENRDINKAESMLEEDHYGLEDVKERILEHIAVSFLKDSSQGKIMCLVGPPGVGKTSVGKSVARALGRKPGAPGRRPAAPEAGRLPPLWDPCAPGDPHGAAALAARRGMARMLARLVGFEGPEDSLAERLAFQEEDESLAAELVTCLQGGELAEVQALRALVRILGTLAGDATGDTTPDTSSSGSRLAQAIRSEAVTLAVLDLLQHRWAKFPAEERPWLLLEGLRSLRLLLLVPADALNAQQRGLRPT